MREKFFQKKRIPLALFVIVLCFPATVCSYLIYTQPPNVVGNFPLQEKWSYESEENIRAIGSSDTGITVLRTANYLVGLDSFSGNELWIAKLKTRINTFAPEFYGGMVFVTTREGIWAFNENTGILLWQVQEAPKYGGNKIAEISECCVFVSNISENVVAYDRLSGEKKWSVLSGRGWANVFVENRVVYIVNKSIRALDEAAGNVLWEEGNSLSGQSAYKNGIIYSINATSPEVFTVYAYDIQKREIQWQVKLLSDGSPEISAFEGLVVAYSNNFLFGLDHHTGKTLWQYGMDNAQTPILLDNIVYSRALFTKSVYAIQVETGEELGYLSLGFPILLPAVEYKNIAATQDLLIVSEKNKVYGYGR